MNKPLKYLGYTVVFQEIPDETTLALSISGCPHNCKGCHSQYLQEYCGAFVEDDLDALLQKYDGLITCVCFMGEGQDFNNLYTLLMKIKCRGLKCALYTGLDSIFDIPSEILRILDFLKIGHYDEVSGGLDKSTTNQKLLKKIGNNWLDITSKFWEKHN